MRSETLRESTEAPSIEQFIARSLRKRSLNQPHLHIDFFVNCCKIATTLTDRPPRLRRVLQEFPNVGDAVTGLVVQDHLVLAVGHVLIESLKEIYAALRFNPGLRQESVQS